MRRTIRWSLFCISKEILNEYPPFNAYVRHQGDSETIDFHGVINGAAEAALQTAYSEAESLTSRRIILNFQDVTYINSTGNALIVGLLARARKSRRALVVFGLSDYYVEIFQITQLADFMTISPL